jgi:hypothetical protein
MRPHSRLYRLSSSVALVALLCDTMLPAVAAAQPGVQPAQSQDLQPAQSQGVQSDQSQGDPPARVGRVARIEGGASFRTTGDTQWTAASANFPVSTGDAFWTEPNAQAVLEISASRVVMADRTELDVTSLDAAGLVAVTPQGETYFHLRDLAPNEVWSVQTPRGLVHLTAPGRYAIAVGNTDQPTMVTVLDGAAEIDGPDVSLRIAANQTARVSGTDTFQGSIGAAERDAFLTRQLNAERPRPIPQGVPPQVAYMPGGGELGGYGNWSAAPDYGQVWYPTVTPGWVPYRDGHWAFVAPWGWTWVDDAPWGFAPFHYGRWVQIDGRWGWTPGVLQAAGPPVYAPALVTFIGLGAGVALGAAIAGGSIGWVPLGPREAYHPWYHASNNYVREVNVSHVTNISNVTTINTYVNRGAATSVPAAIMAGSRPVQAAAQPISPQVLATAQPVVGQQPIRPTGATVGVTPAVARQMNLVPSAAPRIAPGPVVPAQATVAPNAAAGGVPPRPPLPGTATPPAGAARPGERQGLAPLARPAGPNAVPAPAAPNAVQAPVRPNGADRPPLPGVAAPPPTGTRAAERPGFVPPERPPAPSAVPAVAAPRGVQAPGEPGRPPAAPQAERPAMATPRVQAAPAPRQAEPRPPAPMRAEPAPLRNPAPPPRVEAVRPAPVVQAPRVEAVRPAAPPPRVEAPRVEAPRVEAPRPAAPAARPPEAAREKRPNEPR